MIPYPFDQRALTVGELTMEIQSIMDRVNTTFAGRSRVLAEEFLGLQEAIQATLAVRFKHLKLINALVYTNVGALYR